MRQQDNRIRRRICTVGFGSQRLYGKRLASSLVLVVLDDSSPLSTQSCGSCSGLGNPIKMLATSLDAVEPLLVV